MWLSKVLNWLGGLSDSKIERIAKFVGKSGIIGFEYSNIWGMRIKITKTSGDGRVQVTREKPTQVKHIEIRLPRAGIFHLAPEINMDDLKENDLIGVVDFQDGTFKEIHSPVVSGKIVRLVEENTIIKPNQSIATIETTT